LRPQLNLVCVLKFHQPLGVSSERLAECFDAYYEPVVDALEADRGLRLNLHFTGTILEYALAERPEFLPRLKRLWNEERVQLLGGAFHDALLPAIPERDALGQLNLTRQFMKAHLGREPRGGWLCLRAWDPSLIPLLVQAGVGHVLLDDAQFVTAGFKAGDIRGHFTTERAGHCVKVFPIDATLLRVFHTSQAAGTKKALDEMGRGQVGFSGVETFAGNGEELIDSGQFGMLCGVLKGEYHWCKTHLLEQAIRMFPDQGRVYLPTSAQPRLGDFSRPADTVARRARLIRHMETMGIWKEAQQFGGGVVWDNFLVKYPAINQLHKRMLRTSARVDRLRQILLERQRAGKNGSGETMARKILQKAAAGLWKAQNHSVYWHGGAENEGIYDSQLRLRAVRELLVAEALVDRVLPDRKAENWHGLKADLDADGELEALVVTPFFQAIVHPRHGGTLWELDLRKKGLALQTMVVPVEEPYHDMPTGTEVRLVDEDERDTLEGLPAVPRGAVEPALAKLRLDGTRRGAFQDHFFGAETTLESYARRQFREMGDFSDEPYALKVYEPEYLGQPGVVTVSRAGVVKDVDRALLLRIDKSFRFAVDKPRLHIIHDLANRSREPASVWYGMEWTFGIPSGQPEAARLKVLGADDEERQAMLTDGPVDLGDAVWVEFLDAAAGVAIVLQFEEPMGVWWVPIETIHQSPDGFKQAIQGHTLLLHKRREVWGDEIQTMEVTVDFHEA